LAREREREREMNKPLDRKIFISPGTRTHSLFRPVGTCRRVHQMIFEKKIKRLRNLTTDYLSVPGKQI